MRKKQIWLFCSQIVRIPNGVMDCGSVFCEAIHSIIYSFDYLITVYVSDRSNEMKEFSI